ncbi:MULTISPECIES: hypothetical protein [unclassified Allomuricauda]|uniref:hypothetical protein n=1 Tax=unclassified Allomuricauda TaxID=2615049 RepID=UPI00273FDC99|nr:MULTISPECIES: hypothetical protein [unclassified Allomuricauda]
MNKRIILMMLIGSIGLCACEDILEVPDISAQTINILAPTNGTILTNNTVNLNWENVEEATGYTVQVATPNFENAAQILMDSVIEMDTLGYLPTQLQQNLLNGNYEWRVKAFNSGFETLYSTSVFQVNWDEDVALSTKLQLVSSENGSKTDNYTIAN